MKKLTKTLSALAEIVKNPWKLNLILDQNEVWQRKILSSYHYANGLPQVRLDQLQPGFSDTLPSFSFSGGGSLPTDIALLRLLCRRRPNTSYFEIGTWRGESVFNVADIAQECYTLNLSRSQMLHLGMSETYADAHAFFSKNLPNVTHLHGDSQTFDYAGLNKKFDVVFIDGNHHYQFVKSDTKKIFEHLLHPNSVVVWHDYAYNPDQVRFEVMKAILDSVPLDRHHHLYHVANTMCAIYMPDQIAAKPAVPYEDPALTFRVQITAQPIPKQQKDPH